ITPQIDLVVAQALAKKRDERFQTASAFCQAFASALTESGEAASDTPKPMRPTKQQQISNERSMAAFPTLVQPVVRIKTLKQPRLTPWRTGLTLGLIALLLLGCLLSALFIGIARGGARPTSLKKTPGVSHASPDALLANQQDWPTSSTFFFHDGRYSIENKTPTGLVAAFYANHQFTNFRLSLVVAEVKGSYNSVDYYGVVLRASADQAHYYLFEVTTWNGGQYGFLRSDGAGRWLTLASGVTPGLLTHTGQSNVLSVAAQGNVFTFAVNGQPVGKAVHDASHAALASGGIGLVVEEPGTEVAFSHIFISPLP
ncbi:MAG: hypothetical protein ACRDHW_01190, partial [Ktedonobacteraceae bacterium]